MVAFGPLPSAYGPNPPEWVRPPSWVQDAVLWREAVGEVAEALGEPHPYGHDNRDLKALVRALPPPRPGRPLEVLE
jgi:hypothetical protein